MADNTSVQFVIGATLAAGFMGAFKAAASETRMLANVAANAHAKEKELAQQSRDLNRIWEKGKFLSNIIEKPWRSWPLKWIR